MSFSAPIAIGTASTNAAHAADLGKVFWNGGKAYRVVKAANAITAAAGKILVTALSSGEPTYVVDTTTTANSTLVAGIVPQGQVGSTGTTGLIAGDYFVVQVSGPAKALSAATIAINGLIGTSTTAGKVDDASVTAGVGACGTALEAASAADQTIDVNLKGLI